MDYIQKEILEKEIYKIKRTNIEEFKEFAESFDDNLYNGICYLTYKNDE